MLEALDLFDGTTTSIRADAGQRKQPAPIEIGRAPATSEGNAENATTTCSPVNRSDVAPTVVPCAAHNRSRSRFDRNSTKQAMKSHLDAQVLGDELLFKLIDEHIFLLKRLAHSFMQLL